MLQIEECAARLQEAAVLIKESEYVSLKDCCGRILAENLKAPFDIPRFARSAMDGYAVKAADTGEDGVVLRVKGKILAGEYDEITYEQKTAVRVMTGSYIPDGFDAVVKQEDTDMGIERVIIRKRVMPGENYCSIGEDVKKGATLAEKGTLIDPVMCGILASFGIEHVKVLRRPKICIISTGSELLAPGEPLTAGKIYGSVGYMLYGAVKNAGMQVKGPYICPDRKKEARKLIREAVMDSDMVITTGAISVGEKDFLPGLLKEMGGETLFKGADIQPGTPTMASLLGGRIILSLSGNPYAALANFEIYFWDTMAAMTGCSAMGCKRAQAVLCDSYKKVNRHRRLIRARAEDGKVFLPSCVHSSSVISNMIKCNCFIDLEAGRAVKTGDKVRIIYIKGLEK